MTDGVGVVVGVVVGVPVGVRVGVRVGVGLSLWCFVTMIAIGIAAKPNRAQYGKPAPATGNGKQSQTSSATMSLLVSVITRPSCSC